VGFLAVAQSSPAGALDCAKASQPVEKLLCATAALRQADDEMSAAYFKLLRETGDPEFHALLIRSQRRWLAQRLGGPQRFGLAEGDKTDDRDVLLAMTRGRLDFLKSGTPIRTMEDQRRIASRGSGGRFAGYHASCQFLPPPYGDWRYGCWSTVYRQHHDRICSVAQTWASGHMTDYRLVSVVENGMPRAVASCSIGYASTDELCAEPYLSGESKSTAHWNTNPLVMDVSPIPGTEDLWRYDPDLVPEQYDQSWMNDCLFAPVFPPPELSRANATP
jgi:uncharacterized protein YecT (DUF1311 family)